jgi:hypothetical protein
VDGLVVKQQEYRRFYIKWRDKGVALKSNVADRTKQELIEFLYYQHNIKKRNTTPSDNSKIKLHNLIKLLRSIGDLL